MERLGWDSDNEWTLQLEDLVKEFKNLNKFNKKKIMWKWTATILGRHSSLSVLEMKSRLEEHGLHVIHRKKDADEMMGLIDFIIIGDAPSAPITTTKTYIAGVLCNKLFIKYDLLNKFIKNKKVEDTWFIIRPIVPVDTTTL